MKDKKIVSLFKDMLGLTDLTWDKKGYIKLGDQFITSPTGKEKMVLPLPEHYNLALTDRMIFAPTHEEVTKLPSYTALLYRNALLAKLNGRYKETIIRIAEGVVGNELSLEAKVLIDGVQAISKPDLAGLTKYLMQDEIVFDALDAADDDDKRKLTTVRPWSFKIATNRKMHEDDDFETLRVGILTNDLLKALRKDIKLNQLVPAGLKVSKKSMLTLVSLMEHIDKDLETVYGRDDNAATVRTLVDFGNAAHARLNAFAEHFGGDIVELVDTQKYFKSERAVIAMVKSIQSAPYNVGSTIKNDAKRLSANDITGSLAREAAPEVAKRKTPPVPARQPAPVEQELPPAEQHVLPRETRELDTDRPDSDDLEQIRKLMGGGLQDHGPQQYNDGWNTGGHPQQRMPPGYNQQPYPQQHQPRQQPNTGWNTGNRPTMQPRGPAPRQHYVHHQEPPMQRQRQVSNTRYVYNDDPPFEPNVPRRQAGAPRSRPGTAVAQGRWVPDNRRSRW